MSCFSLESRLDTYKESKANSKKTSFLEFALCGLFMSSSENYMTTTCYLCDKTLSYWMDDDIPFVEHLKRHNNCPLYQLHDASQRLLTFDGLKMPHARIRKLAEKGFFAYSLKAGHMDLFCYKCGFYMSHFPGYNSNQMRYHDKKCVPDHKYILRSPSDFLKNPHDLFFIDLLSGRYRAVISQYLSHETVYLHGSLANDLRLLFSFRGKNTFLLNTKSALLQCLNNMIEHAKELVENDENNINNLLDELSNENEL